MTDAKPDKVLPTRVGMVRADTTAKSSGDGVPHPRGDGRRRYNRQVFGRRVLHHDGEDWVVELRRDAIVARKKKTRKRFRIPLEEVLDLVRGQFSLKFGPAEKGKE